MEKISGIYCIENLVNGKKYIGQSQYLESRMIDEHKNCTALIYAINYYGEENFKRYVIEYCPIEELDEKEIFYIKELHSHISENGYNISWGGEAPMRGRKHSEETKQKLKNNHFDNSGINNPMYGKEVSEETRQKISIALSGENSYTWGKTRSEETKQKISQSMAGKYVGENSSAFGKKRKNTSSIYYGVFINRTKGYVYWLAVTSVNQQKVRLGNYKSEIDAAKAYDKYVYENNLPNPLNFPEDYKR